MAAVRKITARRVARQRNCEAMWWRRFGAWLEATFGRVFVDPIRPLLSFARAWEEQTREALEVRIERNPSPVPFALTPAMVEAIKRGEA